MSIRNLTKSIQDAQVNAAEEAVIAGIPPDIMAVMDAARAALRARGGCPGCGSMLLAIHEVDCPELAGDLY